MRLVALLFALLVLASGCSATQARVDSGIGAASPDTKEEEGVRQMPRIPLVKGYWKLTSSWGGYHGYPSLELKQWGDVVEGYYYPTGKPAEPLKGRLRGNTLTIHRRFVLTFDGDKVTGIVNDWKLEGARVHP